MKISTPVVKHKGKRRLLVPLSHRAKLLEFALDEIDEGGDQDYYDVDYILIHKKAMYHGRGGHYADIEKRHLKVLQEYVDKGMFVIISERNDYILLKRV